MSWRAPLSSPSSKEGGQGRGGRSGGGSRARAYYDSMDYQTNQVKAKMASNIATVLDRNEKLDDLAQKSDDVKMFFISFLCFLKCELCLVG